MTTDTLGTVNQTHGHMTAGQQDLASTDGQPEVRMVLTTVSFLTYLLQNTCSQAGRNVEQTDASNRQDVGWD